MLRDLTRRLEEIQEEADGVLGNGQLGRCHGENSFLIDDLLMNLYAVIFMVITCNHT